MVSIKKHSSRLSVSLAIYLCHERMIFAFVAWLPFRFCVWVALLGFPLWFVGMVVVLFSSLGLMAFLDCGLISGLGSLVCISVGGLVVRRGRVLAFPFFTFIRGDVASSLAW